MVDRRAAVDAVAVGHFRRDPRPARAERANQRRHGRVGTGPHKPAMLMAVFNALSAKPQGEDASSDIHAIWGACLHAENTVVVVRRIHSLPAKNSNMTKDIIQDGVEGCRPILPSIIACRSSDLAETFFQEVRDRIERGKTQRVLLFGLDSQLLDNASDMMIVIPFDYIVGLALADLIEREGGLNLPGLKGKGSVIRIIEMMAPSRCAWAERPQFGRIQKPAIKGKPTSIRQPGLFIFSDQEAVDRMLKVVADALIEGDKLKSAVWK